MAGLAPAPVAADAHGPGESAPAREESAPDSCVARTAAAVQRRYEGVRDLSTRFEQVSVSVSLGTSPGGETRSSGRAVFAKPGKMRWSYEAPEPSLVVSDGTTLWLYDPGFGEVQQLPVGDGYLSGAAIQFLLGEGDMLRDFEVRALHCGETEVRLELRPREPAAYEYLELVASPTSGDVSSSRVVDLLGNVTVVDFTELKVNQSPPDETFRFEPPEGASVIDLTVP